MYKTIFEYPTKSNKVPTVRLISVITKTMLRNHLHARTANFNVWNKEQFLAISLALDLSFRSLLYMVIVHEKKSEMEGLILSRLKFKLNKNWSLPNYSFKRS